VRIEDCTLTTIEVAMENGIMVYSQTSGNSSFSYPLSFSLIGKRFVYS